MEARIARLESDVGHIRSDLVDVKQDVRDLRARIDKLQEHLDDWFGRIDDRFNEARDRMDAMDIRLSDRITGVQRELASAKVWALILFIAQAGAVYGTLARTMGWI